MLIVDDDPDDRQIVQDALIEFKTERDYVLLENGDKLMEYLHSVDSGLPCLILLDLNMPGKDGRIALKEIKSNKNFQHIPIIVLTTSSLEKDREMSYALGANCFVTKPNSYTKLIEIMESIVKLWVEET